MRTPMTPPPLYRIPYHNPLPLLNSSSTSISRSPNNLPNSQDTAISHEPSNHKGPELLCLQSLLQNIPSFSVRFLCRVFPWPSSTNVGASPSDSPGLPVQNSEEFRSPGPRRSLVRAGVTDNQINWPEVQPFPFLVWAIFGQPWTSPVRSWTRIALTLNAIFTMTAVRGVAACEVRGGRHR